MVETQLLDALKTFPVCLITGARQAGKSTLLKHTLKNYKYVTLDDPLLRALANDDPELFLSKNPPPVVIDEIQYAPGLLSYIKIRVDENRQSYGQYVLTGSQIFQLMKGVSESLAGRIAIFTLYPFNWREVLEVPKHQKFDDDTCANQIIEGFYPEIVTHHSIEKNLWFGSYLSTYIERDVRNIKSITDLGRFQTFIGLLAARAGKLLNLSDIAKECGITHPTAKDWISILESTYIIYLLRPYHNNLSKRLVKSPKLYFTDTGMLCYLLGIDNAERFYKSSERGHIFENMVVMEAIKQLSSQNKRWQCFFYRTASGLEIDLIVEKEGHIDAFEIKLSKTPNREMAQPLASFRKEHDVRHSQIICLQEKTAPLMEHVDSIHWSSFIQYF
jgi:predicted AAA+ superfamily ATPase